MANPTLLEMPIARDGAKNSIPSTTSPTTGLLSQQFGWQDINSMPVQQGGKAPSRLDFNGVLNLLSKILFYCQKGYQFLWQNDQDYYAGCVVKDPTDSKMYRAKNDVSASNTEPHSDSTNWEVYDFSLLANYLPLSGGGALTGTALTWNGNDLGGSAIVASSLGPWSSYIKLAKGPIIQWGAWATGASWTNDGDGGCYSFFSYPIAFTVKPIIIASPAIAGYGGIVKNATAYATSASQFRLSSNLDNSYTFDVNWLAFGY